MVNIRRSARGKRPSVKARLNQDSASNMKKPVGRPKSAPSKSVSPPPPQAPVKPVGYCPEPEDMTMGYMDTAADLANNWGKKDERDLDQVLQQLQDGLKVSDPVHDTSVKPQASANTFWFQPDPSMILRGPKKAKHLDIVDYVNLSAPFKESADHSESSAADVLESLVKHKQSPLMPSF